MTNIEKQIIPKLFEMKDEGYREFHSRLIPTVNKEFIIGVRIPQLRKFAKELSKIPNVEAYMDVLPHKYYEENNLHAFLIENVGDYKKTMALTERFLPHIDNWATCDSFSPKIFKKHPEDVYEKIKIWLKSPYVYTVRYAIVLLLSNYLDDKFRQEMLDLVASVRSDEYYINMAIAWYFSIALVKKYDSTLPYIENKKLDKWIHNKAIQKGIESYRISDQTKSYLKTLKIK
ncbi:MAG: DNA alkylation repair protein [Eubacteriales bacterium]|nr:DNA alkylation repair protein [Eubacteriales bacterium]MDD4390140.1 DNA alkylation repair protein [Eubacteriales bacterium]